MALVDWTFKGQELVSCNCAWGCPCQFNSLPTNGNCVALGATHIEKGHFGKVKLDGLNWAMVVAWPGPIHLGNGKMQIVIDERADAEQRKALDAIAHGKETVEGGTYMQVFSTTITEWLPTVFRPIEFKFDLKGRTGRISIPGVGETTAEPIRNPVTGAEHRVKVVLPEGFEYIEAEYASATTRATGDIPLEYKGTHAHFANVEMGTNGVVR
jgi:hypothetical protein